MNRRGFLQSILAAGVMPAIVRAESLMTCAGFVIPSKEIILPGAQLIVPNANLSVSRIFTCALDSGAFLEAKSQGLVELRRRPGRHGDEVDFALERPKYAYEERRLIL